MADIIDQNGNPVSQQQAQKPLFQPETNVNVFPDGSGVRIAFVLAPGFEVSTTIGPDLMNQLYAAWKQVRKNVQDQLRVIEHVKSTKVN